MNDALLQEKGFCASTQTRPLVKSVLVRVRSYVAWINFMINKNDNDIGMREIIKIIRRWGGHTLRLIMPRGAWDTQSNSGEFSVQRATLAKFFSTDEEHYLKSSRSENKGLPSVHLRGPIVSNINTK